MSRHGGSTLAVTGCLCHLSSSIGLVGGGMGGGQAFRVLGKAIESIKASSWTRGGYMPFPRSHNELVSERTQELIISDFQTVLSQRPCDPVTSKASLHTLHSLGFSSPPRFPAPLPPLLLEEHQPSTFKWL